MNAVDRRRIDRADSGDTFNRFPGPDHVEYINAEIYPDDRPAALDETDSITIPGMPHSPAEARADCRCLICLWTPETRDRLVRYGERPLGGWNSALDAYRLTE